MDCMGEGKNGAKKRNKISERQGNKTHDELAKEKDGEKIPCGAFLLLSFSLPIVERLRQRAREGGPDAPTPTNPAFVFLAKS